ncbi:hypothetical protein [Ligilactobacillus salivarius]|uniref:hypothetical protein n=1 Tax=Ligilactobacillus salivarius TaxID=1624 RepID=UPI002B47595A|nr:hypothetical protein [Ligilactobacillus salivarius]
MAKINKRAFSKIRQEIDKLAISKRSRAMFDDVEGKYTVGTENTINMTVFLKGEEKVFFRVSSFSINDKWLKIFYLNKARNKKHVAIFKVDNPNFIGYGYEPNEVKI